MTSRHRFGRGAGSPSSKKGWRLLFLGCVFALPGSASGQVISPPEFRPISLDEAVEIARRRNPNLQQAFTAIDAKTADSVALSTVFINLPGP